MGSLNAFYVGTSGQSAVAAIHTLFPSAEVDAGDGWIGVTLDDVSEPPVELATLSADLQTDVIWLAFQSVVDAFQFCHWRSGSLLRWLVFGCDEEQERTWDRVNGEQEAWEQEAFFGPNALRHALGCVDTAEEKGELERIWRQKELLVGSMDPCIDAREVAQFVAAHYNLPL